MKISCSICRKIQKNFHHRVLHICGRRQLEELLNINIYICNKCDENLELDWLDNYTDYISLSEKIYQ